MTTAVQSDGQGSGVTSRSDRWIIYGAIALSIAFVCVFTVLMFRKHDAFNTRTYDLARFDQAIWNTLHGRFLFSTILNRSILGNHFSPYMALLSPLFLLWDNVKVLFLVQAASVAVAGIFLFKIVRVKHPSLALPFLLAFYLNPALHEITTFEFRRVVLAVPFLAMALYALYVKRRWLMVLGLGFALLCKENVGLIVFMAGLYVLLFERDWKWGVPTMIVGGAWVVIISLWVIPAFVPPANNPEVYPQLYYFDFLGNSYSEIMANVTRDPLILVRHLVDWERLGALWRVFMPLGLVLPFLAWDWALICLPTMAYMLMSNEPRLYRFETWHLATVLPVLFAAIGVGLGRRPRRWARWLSVLLVGTTLIGYVAYSPAPLGGTYNPALYEVTDHHRLAAQVIEAVPADAIVATQPRYVPHLAHREHVYHYPWIVVGIENTGTVLLDRHSNPYPFTPGELNAEIDNLVADPAYTIDVEADGIYLFSQRAPVLGVSVEAVFDKTMSLYGWEVSVQNQEGIYQEAQKGSVELVPGQQLRVSLYWEALDAPNAERTVSVRIADSSGVLVAQHDTMPGQGRKPTSWWQKGWKIRDVYYMTVSPQAQPGQGSLGIVIYDSHNHEIIHADGQAGALHLCDVVISPRP